MCGLNRAVPRNLGQAEEKPAVDARLTQRGAGKGEGGNREGGNRGGGHPGGESGGNRAGGTSGNRVRWHLTLEEEAASAGHPAKEQGNRLQEGSDPLQSPLPSIVCQR